MVKVHLYMRFNFSQIPLAKLLISWNFMNLCNDVLDKGESFLLENRIMFEMKNFYNIC